MNNCKNIHYKSSIQFYNTTGQPILAENLITNPAILGLGNKVTDTGCALEFSANGVSVKTSGLYHIHVDANVVGTAAGNVTFAIAIDGEVLPETLRTETVAIGASTEISMETVRRLHTCCSMEDHTISIIAYSDGTGTATVNRLSGNVIKLA